MIPIYTNHLNLGFNKGTLIHNPHKILIGTGNLIRHIPVSAPTEYRNKKVTDLIKNAWNWPSGIWIGQPGLKASQFQKSERIANYYYESNNILKFIANNNSTIIIDTYGKKLPQLEGSASSGIIGNNFLTALKKGMLVIDLGEELK